MPDYKNGKIYKLVSDNTDLNDKKHGEEINYFNTEKNNPRKVQVFDHGVIVSLKSFNHDGKLKEERKYDINGQRIKD